MKRNNIFKKVIIGTMVGCMLFSLGVSTYANADDVQNQGVEKNLSEPRRGGFGHGGNKTGFGNYNEDFLNELITAGIITQSDVDKITSYVEKEKEEREAQMEEVRDMTEEERKAYFEENKLDNKGERKDIYSKMVEDGVLSEEKAQAIKEKSGEQRKERKERQGEITTKRYEKLLEEGIVTQSDIDAITKYMEKNQEERRAQMEKIKDMTKEERKAYFEENKSERSNIFTEIVDDGGLTQERAEAIMEALKGFDRKIGSKESSN